MGGRTRGGKRLVRPSSFRHLGFPGIGARHISLPCCLHITGHPPHHDETSQRINPWLPSQPAPHPTAPHPRVSPSLPLCADAPPYRLLATVCRRELCVTIATSTRHSRACVRACVRACMRGCIPCRRRTAKESTTRRRSLSLCPSLSLSAPSSPLLSLY